MAGSHDLSNLCIVVGRVFLQVWLDFRHLFLRRVIILQVRALPTLASKILDRPSGKHCSSIVKTRDWRLCLLQNLGRWRLWLSAVSVLCYRLMRVPYMLLMLVERRVLLAIGTNLYVGLMWDLYMLSLKLQLLRCRLQVLDALLILHTLLLILCALRNL